MACNFPFPFFTTRQEAHLDDWQPVRGEERLDVLAVPVGPGGEAEEGDGEGQEGGIEGRQHPKQVAESRGHVQVAGTKHTDGHLRGWGQIS